MDIWIRPVRIVGIDFTAGSVIIQPQGEKISIAITLLDDSLGNQTLSGANVTLQIQNDQYGTISFVLVEDPANSGRYAVDISTHNYDAFFAQVTFSAEIFVVKGNYSLTEPFTFAIVISQPEWLGWPQIYWILIMTTAAAIIGIFTIVKVVKNARIPRIIKDISRTRGQIRKDRKLAEIFIVPSKEEVIYDMVASDWKAAGVPLKTPKKIENLRPSPEEELKASELTRTEEITQPSKVKPPEEETKAPEVKPLEEETKAPEVKPLEEETKAPEVKPPEEETKAPEVKPLEE
ncbi:MAG: erythrocyte binding protein, partial [Promethearchaeota archaeon CR_4]